ncbi:CaiB/BaiF CoA transferase family protein [Effusibacillus dendaii]|uniref:CoA transferase n=1 Tax=Effusibacillus dendaii TaxID=2743772 RepID=A0A7I8DAZ5_9BACL|nr:CaiB/BaiF CoA-transferase family protein [Effusibacillus dendaii]BCJ86129.1 CoA transferase [Effusibacillus dendaii]
MLKGIVVADFSRYLPGPYATERLAEMGAQIIKVEPPKSGDPARLVGQQSGTGPVFLANNRSKKSITINLKHPSGQELAFRLASRADVVIEGFRPGVADVMGIGYEKVRQAKPDIVYCSLTGYGQTGPLKDLGGHDINYMSYSGVLSQLRDQAGRPIQPGIQFADLIGGITASEAICAALVKRQLTGEGSFLDISMTDAMIGLMANHVMIQHLTGIETGVPQLGGSIVSYCIYETKEGRFISLGALEVKFWENFCRAVGREEWIAAHFSAAADTNPIFVQVKETFRSKTFAEWSRFAEEVDCCMAPILTTSEMMKHRQAAEKGLVERQQSADGISLAVTHTSAGGYQPDLRTEPAAFLGRDTEEVLATVLKLSAEEIGELRNQGVV